MTGEREAFEEMAQYSNVPRGINHTTARVFWKAGMAWQAAHQDWPSEDDAVRILVRECQFTNQMAKAAYRALRSATTAPKGVE